MNKVYLRYDEDRYGGQPLSREAWSDRSDESIEFSVKGLYVNDKVGLDTESIDVNFDPVQYIGKPLNVVIARYSSGDTFGSSSGHWEIVGAYPKTKDAVKIKNQIDAGSYGGYSPWKGYFESLEYVDIEEMVLQDNRADAEDDDESEE